jgi:ABC-2 type transport system permease protein
MFGIQFLFEWRQWFRGKTFRMYAACFYLFAALSMAGAAGMFGQGSVGKEVVANAPYSLFNLSAFFTKLLLMVIPAIAGTTLLRERQYNIHALFFSYPVNKQMFLWAKLAAIFCLLCFLAFCILAGFITGMVVAKKYQVQFPIPWSTLVLILIAFMVPVLIAGIALVCFTVAFSKNMYHGFVIMICFAVFGQAIERLTSLPILQILTDPIGQNLVAKSTLLLTETEKNKLSLIFPDVYLWNRLWWFIISGFFLDGTHRYYVNKRFFSVDNAKSQIKREAVDKTKSTFKLPALRYDWIARIKLVKSIGTQEAKFIIIDPVFILFNIIGAVWLIIWLMSPHPQTQMLMVPVSGIALGYPLFFYSFLIQLLTFLYAGIVLNRSKQVGFGDLIATTPAPDWVFMVGKWLGLILMQMSILLFLTLLISGVQVFSGYAVANPFHTSITLIAIHLSGFIIWASLALFVQAFTTNTFTGLFVLILITLGLYQLADMGVESPLLRFNAVPEPDFYFRYSDMAGYGNALEPFLAYRSYWLLTGILLLLLAIPFAQREHTGNVKERFRLAATKIKTHWPKKIFVFVGLSIVVTAYCISWFINPKSQTIRKADEARVLQAFKEKFAPFLNIKQPVITKLIATISIKPGASFEANGMYIVKNMHRISIDTLFIHSSFFDDTSFEWQGVSDKIISDELVKVVAVRLHKTLLPGDSLEIKFRVVHANNRDYGADKQVAENGIYLSSSIFPRIGWRDAVYPADSLQKDNHYQGNDEHGLLTDITINTAADHRAFAPGYLVESQTTTHQNIYRYVTNNPVKFSFAILSGIYEQKRDSTGSKQLSIWHHPSHTYCLDNMMKGLKASIYYHEKWFSPLEYDTINIIEFARPYGSFATLAANCIPVSESRFLQDTNQLYRTGTDLGFYVMAHEMSHHWWGNQVLPAHAHGATMLTESLAEYSTLKVYEKQYGRKRALAFLNIQKHRYLAGRAQSGQNEPTLITAAEGDDYLVYGKGALAFYILADKWGEVNLNKLLRTYLQEHGAQKPPYPTAAQLLQAIYREVPSKLHGFIHDAFENNDWDAFNQHLKVYNLP